jgi:DNA-binding winged helix-turn-helix (wHTH) protein
MAGRTETIEAGPEHLRPLPCLIVLSGADRGLALWLDKPAALIGRDEDCDLRLDDASISRHHARIERGDNGWWLVDLDSKNGSAIGSENVQQRAALRDGDLLRLGRIGLQFFMVQTIAAAGATASTLRSGPISIDPLREVALFEDRAIELTPTEFRMLSALMQRPGRVLSQLALMRAAYPDARVVSEATVQSHLRNLRKKLSERCGGRELIRSLYGRGYRIDTSED